MTYLQIDSFFAHAYSSLRHSCIVDKRPAERALMMDGNYDSLERNISRNAVFFSALVISAAMQKMTCSFDPSLYLNFLQSREAYKVVPNR